MYRGWRFLLAPTRPKAIHRSERSLPLAEQYRKRNEDRDNNERGDGKDDQDEREAQDPRPNGVLGVTVSRNLSLMSVGFRPRVCPMCVL